jgi:starch synthase
MIAMRYGCPPVARAVGGLRDTITITPESYRSGYLFTASSTEAFSASLRQALRDFADKQKWRTIQQNGMRKDFSWEKSALQYLQVYSELKNSSG